MAQLQYCITKGKCKKRSSSPRLTGSQPQEMVNGKWYLPSPPSTATITNIKHSKAHKAKGFADDFSVLSSTKDHAAALQTIDKHCLDVDLTLKPCKCVSFVYDGKKGSATHFHSGMAPLGTSHQVPPSSWDIPSTIPCQQQLRSQARDS